MSDIEEVLDEIADLERRIDTLDRTFVKCTSDMLEALKLQADIITQMGAAVSLARSPTKEDLEKYAALREAFDRYEFVRKLTLGNNSGSEKT